MEFMTIVENAFYLLAILNPVSKMMFLSTYEPKLTARQNFELSWKSSLAALIILILLACIGNVLFTKIFHVELYSIQITGGLILFVIGLKASNEGRFVDKKYNEAKCSFTDISLVPLAAPLIAGPGMIASAINSSLENGVFETIFSLGLAIFINFLLMLLSSKINSLLNKIHMIGPLIRLTGFIIATVALQMLINGIKNTNIF